MQSVSSQFETDSGDASRKIIGKLEIDWDKDGSYLDETQYSLVLEIERRVSEPQGGIHLGLCDVTLGNESDRYTPLASNPPITMVKTVEAKANIVNP